MLELIDIKLFEYLNRWAGVSAWLDTAINVIRQTSLAKGVPVFMLWWGLWFAGSRSEKARAGLMATLVIAVIAIFVGRALSMVLPFRLRPMHDAEVNVNLPIGATETVLSGWSSMPSDHAVFFFALALGFYFIHHAVGIILILHATFIVSLPRVFSGYHYPSDMVIGAIIGITIAGILFKPLVGVFENLRLARMEQEHGSILYAFLFLLTSQAATMFESVRKILETALTLAQNMGGV